MSVSMNVDYTRQIYTGLSTDDWGEIEFNAGDVVYIMDQSQCWIFDGSTMQQLPDLGGGGGGSYRLLGSGTYTQTASLGNNNLVIPISVTGNFIEAYVETDSQENVLHTIGWARAIKFTEMSLVNYFTQIIAHYADNSIRKVIDSTVSGNPLCLILDNFENPTTISLRRWGNTCQILPGEFRWYMWGV